MMHTNNPQNHARHQVGLTVVLIILISAPTLATGPISPAAAQADAQGWSYTCSLNQARAHHTATLLSDGKVLVIGGFVGGSSSTNIAELYDPLTGTWSVTGSLNTLRADHTATLLLNGKVLVVGGVGGSPVAGVLASSELYDPSTRTLSLTGSLNVPRIGHTATLLGNGKVLVAGGYANNCCMESDLTNTAELYDPATGEWSYTGNINVLRSLHTATLLSNGKVLYAGGGLGGAFTATNTAELYDPATGTWSLTGNLSETRVGHTATQLQGGKVLVAGGCRDEECFFTLGSAERYDPNTETWSITGSLNTPRIVHTATPLQNGMVLVAGGVESFVLDTAELYDPTTGQWSYTGSLNTPRYSHTETLLPDGKVLVTGTYEPIESAELYDLGMRDAIGVYFSSDRTFYLRNSNSAGFADLTIQYGPSGAIPIVGDWDGNRTTTIGVYDPGSQTFYLRNSNTPGFADLTVRYGPPGAIPLAGDWNGDGVTTIGVYDQTSQTYYLRNSNTPGFADLTIRYGPAGAVPVVGDWDGNGTTTIGVYELSSQTFYLRNSNTVGFADQTVRYGPSGATPVAGDWDGNGTVTIGVYDPGSQTFYLRNSNSIGFADLTIRYGPSGATPLAGDWNGL